MPDRSIRVVEIRTYRLLPGTRDEYDRLFREQALPLLRRFDVDVIAAGPSLDDPNGYYLVRSFADLDQREDRFYASPEWREGPREAVIERIEVYTDAVVELDEDTIEALRRSLAR
jgi:NIPSNAP protein